MGLLMLGQQMNDEITLRQLVNGIPCECSHLASKNTFQMSGANTKILSTGYALEYGMDHTMYIHVCTCMYSLKLTCVYHA